MLRRTDKREVYGVIALLLFSAVIVALQYFGLERSLVLDGRSGLNVVVRDDRAFNGLSEASYRQTARGLVLVCDIKIGDFAWPYCEMEIDVSKVNSAGDNVGVDLSGFERVGLWVRHNSPVQSGTRLQLHNFNSQYSTDGDRETYKFNAVEFYEKFSPYPTWVELDNFHVPTWWLSRNDLDLSQVGVDISNVMSMAFVTGSHIQPGHYEIMIDRLEFRGKIFDTAAVFLMLIGVWGFAAVMFLSQRFTLAHKDLARAREQKNIWEKKATLDPLTGAVNRVGAHKIFARQLFGVNSEFDFSVVFMDIDHFKSINDSCGHAVGDEVLVKFVELIKSNTRDSDTIARWGGEEFILLCPNTSLTHVINLAEKLRAAVHAGAWPESLEVTCSFGVAQIHHGEGIETFIERADKALYSAKNSGRNCVVVADH